MSHPMEDRLHYEGQIKRALSHFHEGYLTLIWSHLVQAGQISWLVNYFILHAKLFENRKRAVCLLLKFISMRATFKTDFTVHTYIHSYN